VSQCSRERYGVAKPEYGDFENRRGRHQLKSRRRNASSINTESHTPKYKHQDRRHQLPRIKAKMERRLFATASTDWEYPEPEREEPTFLSVRDQLDLSGQREDHMKEWIDDLFCEDVDMFCSDGWEFEMFYKHTKHVRPRYYPGIYDHDDASWDDFGCDYPDVDLEFNVSDGWYINSDADDGRDDIFEDYGNMDRDLDERSMAHSSRFCFTGRYRPTRRMLTNIAMLRI
jgi:hypothetical protein